MGPKGIFNSATRHQGYKQALSKHGIAPAPDTFVQCRDISRECGFETMNAILDGDRIPDAVFCFNDQLAIGALKAIKKRGYRIPEQIAVMGFSESQSALLTEPQLSSVAQPLDLIGETAANLLLEKIKNPDAPDRTVVLDARINIRESTDVRPQQ